MIELRTLVKGLDLHLYGPQYNKIVGIDIILN